MITELGDVVRQVKMGVLHTITQQVGVIVTYASRLTQVIR